MSSRVSGQPPRATRTGDVLLIQMVLQLFSLFSTGFVVSFSTGSSNGFLRGFFHELREFFMRRSNFGHTCFVLKLARNLSAT